jgi:hypothetical protein
MVVVHQVVVHRVGIVRQAGVAHRVGVVRQAGVAHQEGWMSWSLMMAGSKRVKTAGSMTVGSMKVKTAGLNSACWVSSVN